jgi:hypothetical protein
MIPLITQDSPKSENHRQNDFFRSFVRSFVRSISSKSLAGIFLQLQLLLEGPKLLSTLNKVPPVEAAPTDPPTFPTLADDFCPG